MLTLREALGTHVRARQPHLRGRRSWEWRVRRGGCAERCFLRTGPACVRRVTCVCFMVTCVCFMVTCVCFMVTCVCFMVTCVCFMVTCVCFMVTCVCFAVRVIRSSGLARDSLLFMVTCACFAFDTCHVRVSRSSKRSLRLLHILGVGALASLRRAKQAPHTHTHKHISANTSAATHANTHLRLGTNLLDFRVDHS
jgi:hypothetical protein